MSVLVSVIIPVYNGEKTIQRCLNSVLAQTYQNIEVLVVDDGSADATADIVRSMQDGRIVLLSQKNNGQGYARNIGIEHAQGEYVGFVDADDTIEPTMVQCLLEAAMNSGAQVVQCAMNDIRENSCKTRPDFEKMTVVDITDSGNYARKYFYEMKHTNEVCNKLFAKNFLTENGLHFSDTHKIFSEDLKLNLDILSFLKRICFVPQPLYNYYISPNGHCLSEPLGRIDKMCSLYAAAVKATKNSEVRSCIEASGLITILSYCALQADEHPQKILSFVKSKQLKAYMHTSISFKKSLKHWALMTGLLIAPDFCKLYLVKKFFCYDS